MNDLEQRLRDAFAGRAATTQIDRRSDLPPPHGGANAGQRSWPLIVGAAAVVVITVVGLAVLVRQPADDVPASIPSTPGSDDDVALAAIVSRDASGCWVAYGLGSWAPARLLVPDGVDQSGFRDGAVVIGEGRVTGAIEDAGPRSAGPDMTMDAECADTTTTVEFATVAQVAHPAGSAPSPTEAATVNFDQHWECGHGFASSDASDQWAISIEPIAGNASQALGTTIELPDDRFAVNLVYGLALSAGHCDTERRPFAPAPVQLASWPIVAGTFTYPETSWICDGSAASTQVVGAIVDTGTGELDLPTTTLRNTAFGCGPGWDD